MLSVEVKSMSNATGNSNEIKEDVQVAQFRFGLIAPVLQGTYAEASEAEYFRRVTANPLSLPDGTKASYSYKTLQKWKSDYLRNGFDGLAPAARSDKGKPRKLSDAAIGRMEEIKEQFPRINATQMHGMLAKEGYLDNKASVSTVQRFFKSSGMKAGAGPARKDRKAFEEDRPCKMWQADTKYMPCIEEDGGKRRVYCMTIIDDHSRMVVGGGLFHSDSAANFQQVLKEAVTAYGAPCKLYVDNGASYANEQLSLICIELGIVLIHAKPRDGAAKGKIERFWRTLDERFNFITDASRIKSLDDYGARYKAYVRSYNTTRHGSTGQSPQERFMATESAGRKLSMEAIEDGFHNRIKRRVRKDSTVSLFKVSYDVPFQFIGEDVEIRYMPSDMSGAYILKDGKKHPIAVTDKAANAHAKRRKPELKLDYEKLAG